ncbi:tRNA pseudouridine(55) synthase TruB [Microcoleus sp. LEGE 07076]|uniref:tRNA pseudouridine(55) synthase TruB n=1 Tax=Microcoleus sp. LEGE 07076 TaxID=915322 RepID=UPI00187EAF43|nr:tRNA pseudouridine(55) synthase TruB [Microcoleus sp. LEGE 07076]MBE9185372.1 tRNA pseudouridine(55) synthase TruB [Microcoleus sp. LEGE 07076]
MTTDGFLNLHKPAGITSHDCVGRVRRLLQLKRVGHGGTLDPAVTGVLPIALGKATRLLQFLQHNKAYRGTIRFGLTTATDDLEGEIIHSQPVPDLTLEKVQAALPNFLGKIEQFPPNFSAVQVGGKRLYELARKGEKVELAARNVEVFRLEILDWRSGDFPELDLSIACGAGTYIRAIARDLGAQLNAGGTLACLTRTESSGFSIDQSLSFAELEQQLQENTFRPILPAQVLGHLGTIVLSPEYTKRWFQGQRLPIPETPIEGNQKISSNPPENLTAQPPYPLQVYDRDGKFLGIGQVASSETSIILSPQIVL